MRRSIVAIIGWAVGCGASPPPRPSQNASPAPAPAVDVRVPDAVRKVGIRLTPGEWARAESCFAQLPGDRALLLVAVQQALVARGVMAHFDSTPTNERPWVSVALSGSARCEPCTGLEPCPPRVVLDRAHFTLAADHSQGGVSTPESPLASRDPSGQAVELANLLLGSAQLHQQAELALRNTVVADQEREPILEVTPPSQPAAPPLWQAVRRIDLSSIPGLTLDSTTLGEGWWMAWEKVISVASQPVHVFGIADQVGNGGLLVVRNGETPTLLGGYETTFGGLGVEEELVGYVTSPASDQVLLVVTETATTRGGTTASGKLVSPAVDSGTRLLLLGSNSYAEIENDLSVFVEVIESDTLVGACTKRQAPLYRFDFDTRKLVTVSRRACSP